MPKSPFWSIAISICLTSAQMLGLQTKEQESTIKITTRLVQINVTVENRKGEPVGDLSKEDFVLYDKGQEEKILFFSKQGTETVPADGPPLPPGAVSNRYANFKSGGKTNLAPLPTSLTVILLDGLNTAFSDQYYSKRDLIQFLNQLQPSDLVAIYTLSNGLRVLNDFTSDTESLLAALAKHQNQDSSALRSSSYEDANTGDDTLDAFLDRANDHISAFYQARRMQTTLEALPSISRHLAGMPGRKNLIWISGGFPTVVGQGTPEFQNFSDDIQLALWTLNNVGVAIYPVDARGLMGAFAAMPSMEASSGGRRPGARGPAPMDVRAQNQIRQTEDTMREIAYRTGGRAFLNTNDLTGAIRRAMDDARITYTLAYTPSHNEWDGKFREIKIKVNRPGLDIRYRKGYYAYPDSPNDPKHRQAVLLEALVTPLASTGLSLAAAAPVKPHRSKSTHFHSNIT
jgi:VWFA-related protein